MILELFRIERSCTMFRLTAALFLLLLFALSSLSAIANTNEMGCRVVVDQAAVTSHARMAAPSGVVVEVSTTDHSGISPVAAGGMSALVGLFGPWLPLPVTSAMSFWLLY